MQLKYNKLQGADWSLRLRNLCWLQKFCSSFGAKQSFIKRMQTLDVQKSQRAIQLLNSNFLDQFPSANDRTQILFQNQDNDKIDVNSNSNAKPLISLSKPDTTQQMEIEEEFGECMEGYQSLDDDDEMQQFIIHNPHVNIATLVPNPDILLDSEEDGSDDDESGIDDFEIQFDERNDDFTEDISEEEFMNKLNNTLLYEGAPVSLLEYNMMMLKLMKDTPLSIAAMNRVLVTNKSTYPQNNTAPTSFKSIKNHMKFKNGNMKARYHCSKCSSDTVYDEKGVCLQCGSALKTQFFIRKPSELLRERLKSENFRKKLSWKRNFGKSCSFLDITKSPHYLKCYDDFTDGLFCWTSTFYTDGGQTFTKSQHCLWPALLVINELDPSIRYLPENVLLVGLSISFPFFSELPFC